MIPNSQLKTSLPLLIKTWLMVPSFSLLLVALISFPADGQQTQSQANQTEVAEDKVDSKASSDDKSLADKDVADSPQSIMDIQVVIKRPDNVKQYYRPYVAVWMLDGEDLPTRTLALWMQENQNGKRWHRNVRTWFRDERLRQQLYRTKIVDGLTSATRAPGTHTVVWDGLDDRGKKLEAGTYTLLIELVREHGGRQLIEKTFHFGKESFETELAGGDEIKSVKVTFHGIKSPENKP